MVVTTEQIQEKWFTIKFVLVALMTAFHMYCAKIRKDFEAKENARPESFFRLINEIPTVLFILIVLVVIFKHLIDKYFYMTYNKISHLFPK